MAGRSDVVRQATGLALVSVCLVTLLGGALLTGSSFDEVGDVGSGFSPDVPDEGSSEAGESGDGSGDDDSEDDSSSPPPEHASQSGAGAYAIAVSGPIRPGRTATISVKRDGRPVEGVAVSRDGEFVGRTDQFGRTSTVIPYEASMTLAAERASHRTADAPAANAADDAHYHPSLDAPNPAEGIVTANVSVPTDVAVVPLREPRPGRTVTFLAHVGGAPVADGTVSQDGERLGRTDENGRFELDIPWNESTTVGVERGEATGERTMRPGPLDVSVSSAGLGVLAAGQPVAVQVTQGDRPVEGAAVTLGDDDRVRTDVDGTATVTLPRQRETTVRVQRGDMRATTTLQGLFVPYVAPLLGAGAAVLTMVVLVVFRGRIGEAGAAAHAFVTWLGRHLAVALVRAADALVSLGTWLRETLAALVASLRRRDPLAAIALLRDRVLGGLRAIAAWIRSLSRSRLRRAGRSGSGHADDAAAVTAPGARRSTGMEVIRRAFAALVRRVPGRVRTMTPTEIGQRAVDRGLPADAVWTITDTFRDVTYGGRDPETPVDDVRAAADRVRAADETATAEEEP